MIDYRWTSWEAWKSFQGTLSKELDSAIMEAICTTNDPEGIICQHIEEQLGRLHQAVSGNLRHLYEKGWVTPSGYHGYTRSGRRAMKWWPRDPTTDSKDWHIPHKARLTTREADLLLRALAIATENNRLNPDDDPAISIMIEIVENKLERMK